jgi:hypothetical protein
MLQQSQVQTLMSIVQQQRREIAALQNAVRLLEQNQNAVVDAISKTKQQQFWMRDVVTNPHNFERWQPVELHRVTGFVVRHLPNDAGVKSPKAIAITDENINELALAQNEWQQRNPELYESYKQGPKAHVIIPIANN